MFRLLACAVFRSVIVGAWIAGHAASALEHATDWPSFQGPRGDGSSPETGLLREWPQDGPPVAWRAKIGQGWGQPANSSLPVSPQNRLRTRLSLKDYGKPYHPIYNSVVFKAGCP